MPNLLNKWALWRKHISTKVSVRNNRTPLQICASLSNNCEIFTLKQWYSTLARHISIVNIHSNQPNNPHHSPFCASVSAFLSVFIYKTFSLPLRQPALHPSVRVVERMPAQTADVLNRNDTQSLNPWQCSCWARQSNWIYRKKGGSLEEFFPKGFISLWGGNTN